MFCQKTVPYHTSFTVHAVVFVLGCSVFGACLFARYPEVDPIILSVDETTEVSIKDVVEHIVRAVDFKVR